MAKQKHTPERRCVSCGNHRPKEELLRIVRPSGGTPFLDRTGKADGRGAYVCRSADCLKAARKGRKLDRALSARVPDELFDALEKECAEPKE